jgi:hypothetical protein
MSKMMMTMTVTPFPTTTETDIDTGIGTNTGPVSTTDMMTNITTNMVTPDAGTISHTL